MLVKKLKLKGKSYLVSKSKRKAKEYVVIGKGLKRPVHFADPDMPEYPGTKRGDRYCQRQLGISNKYKIKNDVNSPNYWGGVLWSCKDGKSVSKKRFFGGLK